NHESTLIPPQRDESVGLEHTRLACWLRRHRRNTIHSSFQKNPWRGRASLARHGTSPSDRRTRETRALPELSSPDHFLGVGFGFAAAAAAGAAASSIPKVQCASTFFPWDFAPTITVHVFSRNFCVT